MVSQRQGSLIGLNRRVLTSATDPQRTVAARLVVTIWRARLQVRIHPYASGPGRPALLSLALAALLPLSFSCFAKATELSCEGSAEGSNYALHLYLDGATVMGFRLESSVQSGDGDCELEASRDGQAASQFLKAQWASNAGVTTISIKDTDGFHDPKGYATVEIRRGSEGYSLAYHMDGAASACGVRGYLPSKVVLAPGQKHCKEG